MRLGICPLFLGMNRAKRFERDAVALNLERAKRFEPATQSPHALLFLLQQFHQPDGGYHLLHGILVGGVQKLLP